MCIRDRSKEAAEAIEPTVTGNVVDEQAPPIKPGITKPPFACGPRALKRRPPRLRSGGRE